VNQEASECSGCSRDFEDSARSRKVVIPQVLIRDSYPEMHRLPTTAVRDFSRNGLCRRRDNYSWKEPKPLAARPRWAHKSSRFSENLEHLRLEDLSLGHMNGMSMSVECCLWMNSVAVSFVTNWLFYLVYLWFIFGWFRIDGQPRVFSYERESFNRGLG